MAPSFTITPQLLEILQILKSPSFEGDIPYMYVDSVEKITVGIGHNLDAHHDVLTLPFVVKRFERHRVKGGDVGIPITTNKVLDRPATQAEIQNDYNFLKAHTGLKHYSPENLGKYTTLELDTDTIEKLFKEDLNIAAATAVREFGRSFTTFPVKCQAALIDIAYNCGHYHSFKINFVPAIKGTGIYQHKTMAQRWKAASDHCRRGKVSAERNIQTARWLMAGTITS